MKNKPNDQYIMSALYGAAKRNQDFFYGFTAFGFVFSSTISILSNSNVKIIKDPNFILSIIVVSGILIFLGYYHQDRHRLRHAQAEKFRKKMFIDEVLKSSINNVGDGFIYYSLGEHIIEEARNLEKNDKKQSHEESPYFTVLESYEGRILECIQQNCNQTAIDLITYYQILSKVYMPILYTILGSVGLGLLFAMINYNDRAFDVSQLFTALISLYFSLDFYKYYRSLKSESLQLERLGSEIGIVKENVEMPEVMYYFSEYIAILETKPMVPYRVYERNNEEINIQWRSKLLKEKEIREKTSANKSISAKGAETKQSQQ